MNTRLILEFCCNHNGSMDNAKKMIDDAARLGAWAVKLQKRNVESIPDGLKCQPRKPENSFGATYYEHRKALEFSVEQIAELRAYAKKEGLFFGVTVFDMASTDAIMAMTKRPDFVKLPSQLYTDYAITRWLMVARDRYKDFQFFASCGMHDLEEVTQWQYFGAHDVTFYCRSMYPLDWGQGQFAKMRMIRDALDTKPYNDQEHVLGYSSHEEGGRLISAAVLLGAEYVERHYTLDKTMKGSDQATVSSDFEEMQDIIQNIEAAEQMLGCLDDPLDPQELAVRKIYRGF